MRISLYLLLFCLICSGCTQTPPATSSFALTSRDTWLSGKIRDERPAARHLSGFHLLNVSEDAFVARAALARAAQKTLDIQYYIVHDGLTTRALIHEVLQAADRGVRVRFLIDDTASDGWDYELGQFAAHPNIHVRVFNPLHQGRSTGFTRQLGRLLHLSQQHRRMHNKLWLADSAVAILGGRNLGDEYFDAKAEMNFTDLDLLGAGPVAQDLARSFDQYWNSTLSRPISDFLRHPPSIKDLDKTRRQLRRYLAKESVKESGYIQRLFNRQEQPSLDQWLERLIWAPAEAIWDDPLKVITQTPRLSQMMTTQLIPLFYEVSDELIIVSAYFVPTEIGVDYLTRFADNGLDVRLLTNSLEATDVPAVHAGYAPYRKRLLQHGIQLYELRAVQEQRLEGAPWRSGSSNASLHSKALVFDRQKVFLGSFNIDPRSVLWNTEVGVIIDSPELAEQVRELALSGMSSRSSYRVLLDAGGDLIWSATVNDRRKMYHREPGNLWRRLTVWVVERIGLEKML